MDCIALSIREVGPSTRRSHDDASKIPCFDTLTVEIGMCLARGDPSQAGCGGGLSRIAYLALSGVAIGVSQRVVVGDVVEVIHEFWALAPLLYPALRSTQATLTETTSS